MSLGWGCKVSLVSSTGDDERWMRAALREAERAAAMGEVPVGAVVVADGEILGSGCNRRETDQDPLAHAEASHRRGRAAPPAAGASRARRSTSTLEPCAMRAGALVQSASSAWSTAPPTPRQAYCGTLGDSARPAPSSA
jgi:tRNA(adenine34) deaminase